MPDPATKPPTISLALQGGGSHGAFTWGVLDRLLQEVAADRIRLAVISGAATCNKTSGEIGWEATARWFIPRKDSLPAWATRPGDPSTSASLSMRKSLTAPPSK